MGILKRRKIIESDQIIGKVYIYCMYIMAWFTTGPILKQAAGYKMGRPDLQW